MIVSEKTLGTMKPALWWEWDREGAVRCLLCPHVCRIKEGQKGICGVRKHVPGLGLVSLNEDLAASVAVDPVEKKPLFHFHPGAPVLSLGTIGCNLECPFCQNWQLARCQLPFEPQKVTPENVLEMALERDIKLVAFTYNEPTIWYEFVLNTSRLLRARGILVVLVTNGFIRQEPLRLLLPLVSAANVDVKAFRDEDYRKLSGLVGPVKETVKKMLEQGVHVELTHLSVPGINDDLEAFQEMVHWIAGLNRAVPLHITRYFPQYHWDRPPTELQRIRKLIELAKKELFYVYPGNTQEESSTRCSECGHVLVRRSGYQVDPSGLDPDGRCRECGARNNFCL